MVSCDLFASNDLGHKPFVFVVPAKLSRGQQVQEPSKARSQDQSQDGGLTTCLQNNLLRASCLLPQNGSRREETERKYLKAAES